MAEAVGKDCKKKILSLLLLDATSVVMREMEISEEEDAGPNRGVVGRYC